MKRKPNNGAGPEPREAAGAAEPGGAGERNAGGTSGQSVPKSKFRQKSNQEKVAASKLRMEKRGEKLDRAKEKLAKQKPPKKPGPVRRVGRVASGSAHSFAHGKIYENEHENVGIEGAHRSELVGESALRHGSRFVKRKIREHPAKAVQKAESRYIKATADYHFHTAAQEHPELSKNALSRFWQKRRLRRRYQKQAKEAAKYGAQAAGKTAVTTEKLAARAVGFVKRHPVGCLLALAAGGCAPRPEEPEGGYCVYYSALSDRFAPLPLDCEPFEGSAGDPIPALVDALLSPPETQGLATPFPEGVRLLSWELEEGRLHLDLSEQYGGLSGVDLTVAEACLTLTLCQVEGVESVYVTVEGREIPYRRVQQLGPDGLLLTDGTDVPPEEPEPSPTPPAS